MIQKAIDPNLWGASAWHILHRLSFVFRNAKEARVFYKSLLIILPCPKCRESFRDHLKKNKFPTHHKDIPKWCVNLHNMVNKSLDKPDFPISDIREIENRYHAPNETEWTFISALIDSHPGKRGITEEYAEALHTFLTTWAPSWSIGVPSVRVASSKALLEQWMRKNNRKVMDFGECSSHTCELRAGAY